MKSGGTVSPGVASFAVEGMSCASCAARIERALSREHGVLAATVNYASGTLSLQWDPRLFDAARARERVEALGAAHVAIRAEGVAHVAEALELARRTRSVMKQNLGWALAYNTAAISLSAAGAVTPAIAAGAMAASSVSVVLSSLRLARR